MLLWLMVSLTKLSLNNTLWWTSFAGAPALANSALDIADSRADADFKRDKEEEQGGSDTSGNSEEEEIAAAMDTEQDEYSQAPWERPCPELFAWDGIRDVMVLAELDSSHRGWCQGHVVRETAKTLHFTWPGMQCKMNTLHDIWEGTRATGAVWYCWETLFQFTEVAVRVMWSMRQPKCGTVPGQIHCAQTLCLRRKKLEWCPPSA